MIGRNRRALRTIRDGEVLARPGVARRLLLSRLALAWERMLPAVWPSLAVLGVFLTLSLLDAWTWLPGWLHLILLIGFFAAIGGGMWRQRAALGLPDIGGAMRRLETTGGVAHRPLTTLLDSPAGNPDRAARHLWRRHQERMAEAISRLRVAWPKPRMAERDPLALRALILIGLLVSLFAAGGEAPSRLVRAFLPDLAGFAAEEPGLLTAWITPPDYTGLPPIFLTSPKATPTAEGADNAAAEAGDNAAADAGEETAPVTVIKVAVGSRLVARVHGGGRTPSLTFGGDEQGFATAGESDFELERVIDSSAEAVIAQGRRDLGRWAIEAVADAAPTIAFVDDLQKTAKGVLRIEYRAGDDYGLVQVKARIARVDQPGAPPLDLDLPLPGIAPTNAQEASYHDLTPHPWAGLPVKLTLNARDQPGQTGESETLAMVLPERLFTHPVAKAIIEQRRTLALDPVKRREVQHALSQIIAAPAEFEDDLVAYIALRIAISRLRFALGDSAIDQVVDLLWETALRIEDGALSIAEQDLRAAQEELREALERGASPEEIRKLMDKVQEALTQYLDQLEQQRGQREADSADRQGQPESERVRSRSDLQQMLDQARDLAQTGAREAAQELLSQLQEMLENLQTGQSGSEELPPEGEQMMRELEQMMSQQEQLLDDSFRDTASRGENERLTPGKGDTAADKQEALRRALGDVMRRLGEQGQEIPDALGKAERMMRDARDALERGRPDRALDPQARAIEQLEQGAATLRDQFARQTGEQGGVSRRSNPSDDSRDPLGRLPPGDGSDPHGYVEIPSKSDVQRSREILNELHRRSGERSRPAEERDYIDRLLRWF